MLGDEDKDVYFDGRSEEEKLKFMHSLELDNIFKLNYLL